MIKTQSIKSGIYGARKLPQIIIKPNELGFIRQNGYINFLNEDSAMVYAINRVFKTVNDPDIPKFERAVLVNKNCIEGEIDGDKTQIDFESWVGRTAGRIFVHSHPEKTTISMLDYASTHTYDMDGVIVCDCAGNMYSLIKKSRNGSLISKIFPDKYYDYNKWRESIKAAKIFSDTESRNYKGFILKLKVKFVTFLYYYQSMGYHSAILEKIGQMLKFTPKEEIQLERYAKIANESGAYSRLVDEMWQKHAKKLHCSYTKILSKES